MMGFAKSSTHPTGYALCNQSADLPDGQISDLPVQPPLQKYSASLFTQITFKTPAVPSLAGALAIVTNVGMGCGGRGSVGRVT
jgi:hypothetical protein